MCWDNGSRLWSYADACDIGAIYSMSLLRHYGGYAYLSTVFRSDMPYRTDMAGMAILSLRAEGAMLS